jgi:oligopeptide transport system ATP-binding protein
VVRYIADRIAVMHFGKIVELGESEQLMKNPRHGYTRELLASIPRIRDTA